MSSPQEPSARPSVQLPLEHSVRAPAQARRGAREVLLAWRLPALVDSVVLVVSELVTNAVRHGRPKVYLVLRRRGDELRVDVHDGDPHGPDPQVDPTTEHDESGRGLTITRALATDVGWETVPGDGKLVYARFPVEPDR